MKEADSVLSRLFSFPTAHSLEIVFWDGEFVLHDVMFDLRVMLVLQCPKIRQVHEWGDK